MRILLFLAFINTLCFAFGYVGAFRFTAVPVRGRVSCRSKLTQSRERPLTRLFLGNDSPTRPNKVEYSREIYLREEIESPFRKIRFFFYFGLGGGALTSLFISVTRIAAALSGVNTELMQESLTNAAIDLGGLVVLTFLFQRDLAVQESRLKRASKGAELAKLMVRASQSMLQDTDLEAGASAATGSSTTFTTSLASLRRGRGIEKRVVIAAAGKDKIAQVIEVAKTLDDSLALNDLLVVPVVLPQGVAPLVDGNDQLPNCVALPTGNNWKGLIDDEAMEARNQGVDTEKEGFCVILKKNGRVGQRTKGIFLDKMVGEVIDRREVGFDIKNI